MLNILFKSVPNTLIAMLARVPEIMWSIRCPSGCPTVAAMPGTPAIFLRTSIINSSLLLSLRVNRASTSALFTVCACSSNSPHPVRREVLTISGMESNSVSTKFPNRLLSSNEVPGLQTTDKVSEPSLNSGRKVRPKVEYKISETRNSPNEAKIKIRLCCKAHSNES